MKKITLILPTNPVLFIPEKTLEVERWESL